MKKQLWTWLLKVIQVCDTGYKRQQELFEKRLEANPRREYEVQKIRRIILDHGDDNTGAALEILERYFPESLNSVPEANHKRNERAD